MRQAKLMMSLPSQGRTARDMSTELLIRCSNNVWGVFLERESHAIFMALAGYRQAGGLRMLEAISRSYDSGERLVPAFVEYFYMCCTSPGYCCAMNWPKGSNVDRYLVRVLESSVAPGCALAFGQIQVMVFMYVSTTQTCILQKLGDMFPAPS